LSEPVFEKAFGTAEYVRFSQEVQEVYQNDLKIYRDNRNVVETARIEGEAKGKAEGLAEGEARGKAEGLAEGEARGEVRGKARGKAEALLTVLQARFGKVPQSIVKAVNSYSDLIALESLTVLAATCNSLNEFKEGLK
jgi:flagellar biosynthesis/type III secretory pathway protein FliH